MIDAAKIVECIHGVGSLTFNNKELCGIDTLSPSMLQEFSGMFCFMIPLTQKQFQQFKGLFGENRFCEYSLSLDISAYHVNDSTGRHVLTMKLSRSKFTHNQRLTVLTVDYLHEEKPEKIHFIAKNKHELDEAFGALRTALPITQIEEKLKRYYRVNAKPHPSSFWGKEWRLDKYCAPYSAPGGIDAVTVETFRSHVASRQLSKALVVDVGGGDGRLAHKLLLEAKHLGMDLRYILIEPECSQCEAASQRLKDYKPTLVFNGTLQDFMGKLKEKDFQDQLDPYSLDTPNMEGAVDLIISSGGPLNNQVVSYATAYDNAGDYLTMLAEGGAVIATGLTSLLLSKKNLETLGFKVENCVAAKRSHTISESTTYHPAYVMSKPAMRTD